MNKQSQETHPGVSWLMIGLLVILGLIVLMMASPIVVRANTRADMTMATSNAKQIFYLLIEFDMDYGEFPGDATAIVHKKGEGGEEVDLRAFKGRYSNDYFGQFFGAGYVKSEEIFVTPWKKDRSRKADNEISPRERLLEAGECGFSYVKNQSTSMHTGRPVLMASMSRRGDEFDKDIYDGKAVILRIDGAVKQLRLKKNSNRAYIGQDKTLFEGGEGSVWGVHGFDPSLLVHPKPHR